MTTELTTQTKPIVDEINERPIMETFEIDETPFVDERELKLLKIKAFCMLIGGFFSFFTVFGLSFTYGIFYEFYLSEKGPLYGEDPSKVAMIGTLTTAVTYSFSIFQPILRTFISFKLLMFFGGVLFSLGLFLASISKDVWEFAMTQGLLVGIGSSLIYLQPVNLAPQYFTKRRGTAMGFIFAGTGFGAFAMGPFSSYLISHIGWKNALRVLGSMGFILSTSSCMLINPYPNSQNNSSFNSINKSLINFSVLKSNKLMLHLMCGLLQSLAYLIPTFYMSSYGITLGFSSSQCALLIGINNLVNAISKIALGYIADASIGRFNMLIICCMASTATVFSLWLIPNRSTFLAFVILYGVTSGPIISLLPTSMVELFGANVYQSVTAFLFLMRGIGNALGAPIAGVLLKQYSTNDSDYRSVILYTGAALATSSFCALVLRVLLTISKKS